MKIRSLFLLAVSFFGSPNGAYADDTVKIVAQNWSAARLMARIAEQIIADNLDTAVEVVEMGTGDALPQLASGDVHLALEMWNSGRLPEQLALIDSGEVGRVGDLGVVGQVGWFVPSYVLESNPELASWEAFQSKETAALFATDSTAPLGRFLGVDPSWGSYDEEIIENLGMPFVVEYAGSEKAAIEALANAVAKQEFIVMYWWTPTAAVAQFDLKQVALPPITDECTTSAATADGKYSCAYPEDPLFKLTWPGLQDAHPTIHAFAQEFAVTNEIQLELIPRVEVNGEDPASVAADWVENNQAIWEPWVEVALQAGDTGDPGDEGETSSSSMQSLSSIATAVLPMALIWFGI